MNIRRSYAITLRQFFLIRESPIRFFNIFTWTIIDLILWGFLSRYLDGIATFNATSVLLGAVVLWGFLSQVQRGFILASLEDVYTRNHLNLFSSPLSVGEYIAGLVLSTTFTTGLAMLVVLPLAAFAFGFSPLVLGLELVPLALALYLFGVSLGIFAAALTLRFGPSAEWLAWPIPALVSPFVGIFYPLSVLPQWMQFIGHLTPASYVFEAMRAIVSGHAGAPGDVWGSCAIALLYVALSSFFFVRIYRFALRRGLIARFSAESYSS